MRLAALLFLPLLATGCHRHRKTISAPNSTEYADNILAIVNQGQMPALRWPNYSDYQAAVKTFYDDRNDEIAWVRDGGPTAQATSFVKAFEDAGAKGLSPEDYDSSRWAARTAKLAQIRSSKDSSGAAQDAVAQFDVALTICVMRYISDLRIGRVNPQHFNFDIDVEKKKYDLAEFVSDNAVDAKDVPGLLRSVEPDSAQYRATEAALAHYLDLAKLQELAKEPPLPMVAKAGVSAGGAYPAAGELMARLQLEGDLPGEFPFRGPGGQSAASESAPAGGAAQGKPRLGAKTLAKAKSLLHRGGRDGNASAARTDAGDAPGTGFNPPQLAPVYTPELAEGVKSFQHRHGLTEDGKLTPQTIASLNVPVTERVIQLQNSLERWRWLPNEYVNAPLMVNLPEFVLHGYTPDHKPDFTMKVVVGKVVGDHDTPVFAHMMQYLIFRPYWNVPHDIVVKELLPHIQSSGIGYLSSKNFETTDAKGNPVQPTVEQVSHGGVLVREKPGPKNSLGLVKFMFPNQYDIYLHSTPAPELFNRTRRDFSHGCIRVQDPEALAAWVLRTSNTPGPQGQPWTAEEIHDAMNGSQDNHQVNLKQHLPIVIFYLTAMESDDGHTHFFEDLYGYDQKLQQVLSKGPPYPVRPDAAAPKPKPGDTV
ncbi:MAG: L,D-transpeptidase family protein [Acidobacteriota bacterium]|nr:L,D-transpeptidase family protein [Acidobacteriota bacterium]